MKDGGVLLGASLLLVQELLVLYAAGSYAMGRLVDFAGSEGILGRSAFYLACLITGTKVVRFAPFSPQRATYSRLVRHERRAFPIKAIIGLAPVLLNPLGLLFTTALLTPLTFRQMADPAVGIVVKGIFASGFPTGAQPRGSIGLAASAGGTRGGDPTMRIPEDWHRRYPFLGGQGPVRAGSGALRPAGRGSRRWCLRDGALEKVEAVVKHDRARLPARRQRNQMIRR